ncbi:uncharacterized protein TNCV_1458101 [Trichonephila clavipes]|nr:uncharacterized protein TNCV_1458101 [Trichonephila clavipes]
MEVERALRIFNRSEVLHNLRYTQYLGDGDSKAYKAVLESKPYKDVNIEKLECVGHVEKRMGGRNRLTDAEIDKLQRYYGLAIRNNSGNLSAMKQAIWAIFFHKISTDLNPQHSLCPLGDDSWCGYNRSKLKGDTYKHKHNLPIAIMHCIKKVFRDLSSPELLSRCLHVIYSQFGLAIHQNDPQARRRFVEWAQNEIAVVPDFHKRILFSDEAHFWLNGYVNKQNGRIWSEANPQVYVETPLHPEKLTVWCALWAGGILLQKR